MLNFRLILLLIVSVFGSKMFAVSDSITIITVHRDESTRESLKPRITFMDKDSVILHVYDTPQYNEYLKCWFMLAKEQLAESYIIKAELEGYETSYETITIKKGERELKEATGLLMRRSRKVLQEVTVEASKILMVNKGDTIEYDATAFILPDGSMLDDLIRALPGASIQSGRITINGQYVSRLLVNGRDFFHGDAKVALQNLPAYYVRRIKAYHEISPEKRFREGDSARINPVSDPLLVDVELKRDYAEGWTVNAEAAYGTSDRYLFRLFGMRYTRHSGLYVFGNINNTNDAKTPDKEGEWSGERTNEGVTRNESAGVDFSLDTKKTKTQVNSSVKFNFHDTDAEQITSAEQYLHTGDIFSRSRTLRNSRQTDVAWKNSYKYEGWKTGKKGYFAFMPNVSYSCVNNTNLGLSANFLQDPKDSGMGASLDSLFSPLGSKRLTEMCINRRELSSRSRHKTWNLGTDLSWQLPLAGVRLNIGGHYTKKQSRLLDSDNIRYRPDSQTEDVLQQRYGRVSNLEYDFYSSISSRPLRMGIARAFVDYSFSRDYSSGERQLFRLDSLEGNGLDLSDLDMQAVPTDALQQMIDIRNSYETVTATNKHDITPQLNVMGEKVMLTLSAPVNFYHRTLSDYRNATHTRYTHQAVGVMPNVSLQYQSKQTRFLSLNLNYRLTPPRMGYMLEVRDDSDPLNISMGNSELCNEQQFTTSLQQIIKNPNVNRTQDFGVDYGLWHNSVTTARQFDKMTGVNIYKPMNINGNWYVAGHYYINTAIDKKRHFFISNQTRFTYRNSVDFASDMTDSFARKNIVLGSRVSNTLKMDFHTKHTTFSPVTRMEWIHAESPSNESPTVNAFDINYGVSMQASVKSGVKIGTDLSVWSHRGYSDRSMNTDEILWNARLTYSCLKEKNLIFKMEAHDILNSIGNVRNVLNAQARTETWYNTLHRYMTLHVVYRFYKKPKDRT